jgi:UDP-GlcNAc:undecaprenyl-phosphate GlcNAc-1-phosphate transferase
MIALLTACAVAVAVVWLTAALLRKSARLEHPRGDRWHIAPTPSFGGIGLAAGIIAGALIAGDAVPAAAVPCIAFAALAGTADDILRLRPATKLLSQALVLPLFAIYLPEAAGIAGITGLCLLYLAVVNAVNLFDNFDGALAVTAVGSLAAGAFTGIIPAGSVGLAAAGIGGTAGFALWNLPPARIFMGETGAAALAATMFWCAVGDESDGCALRLLALAALPVADALRVAAARTLRGKRFWEGGRDHAAHIIAGRIRPAFVLLAFAVAQAWVVVSISYIFKKL